MSLCSSQSMPTTPHLNTTDTTYMSPTSEEICRNNNADEDNQIDIFNAMNSRLFIIKVSIYN